MCLNCFLSRISICVVVFSVSSLLPTALPYRNTAFIVALVILSFVFTAKCGSLLKILVSAKDADFAFCSRLRKWTLYLSCFFASPKYVDDGVLVMQSPARLIFDLEFDPLNIAYSVFEVFIFRSYSLAHNSTWSHSSCRLRRESARSTKSSAYNRQLILGSPCTFSPVPCLFSL